MNLASVGGGVSAYAASTAQAKQVAVPEKKAQEQHQQEATDSTKVQLSAQAKAKSASESQNGLTVSNRPDADKVAKQVTERANAENKVQESRNSKAAHEEEQRAEQARNAARKQQGFSFNGAAAYSRVSTTA